MTDRAGSECRQHCGSQYCGRQYLSRDSITTNTAAGPTGPADPADPADPAEQADPADPADKPTNMQNSRAGPTDNIAEARPTVRCLLVFASWGHPSPGHIAPYFIANSYRIDDATHSPVSGAAPADWD